MKLKLGELCAGYGGLGMAVEDVFNADAAWFSEFEEAPSKILAHHWPHVPNHGDMTKINWAAIEFVDIISGGTPCQDLSSAGARRGMTEGTRSNLWVHMREAIAVQQPLYVAWENVRGAYSATAASDLEQCPGCLGDPSDRGTVLRALGRVLGDLSDLGYDCQWRGLRAADVGACHGRFRVFALARNSQMRRGTDEPGHPGSPSGEGRRRTGPTGGPDRSAAHSPRLGWREGWTESAGQLRGLAASSDSASTSNTTGSARRGTEQQHLSSALGPASELGELTGAVAWGDYEPAIRRWEARLGRPAPRPTEPTGRTGGERLSPRFTEWMMGLPDGWVTDPAIGISRNEQLKACGNGVVPQQAIAALQDMLAAFQAQPVADVA